MSLPNQALVTFESSVWGDEANLHPPKQKIQM